MAPGVIKRACLVWHRRSGKDKTALNFTISKMFPENTGGRIGTYFHLFPTYAQGKKIIWDGIDASGFKVTDHFPAQLVKSRNESELQTTLINGSIHQVIGTDKIDSIVGTNPVGCVFSEYALQNPRAWDLIRPILAENGGWAIFNYTPRGHNHGKAMFEAARDDPSWYCSLLTVDQTLREDGRPVISSDMIEQERHGPQPMPEELIQQEYYCSFEGYQQGAYYSQQLRNAEKEGRITSVPHNSYLPVSTWWDLGIGDATAIWFSQAVHGEVRMIDYYETSGEGMSYYTKLLKDKPYTYDRHYMPFDADVRELGTGKSRRETAESLGLRPVDIVTKLPIDDGINAARQIFPRCWFDKVKCEQGLNALANYHKDYDEIRREFKAAPYHDWSSHGADAFRYFAVGFQDRVDSAFITKPKVRTQFNPYHA